jgi:uncharacterized protein
MISVTLVYALPQEQIVIPLRSPLGGTLQGIIAKSGLYQRFPEAAQCNIGVWGVVTDGETVAKDGDRIELYRPLTVDPKVARAARAAKKRAPKKN